MKYSSLIVDENGHLIDTCPICGNEKTSNNYCSICGVYIVNECSGVKFYQDDNGNEQIENLTPCDVLLQGYDRYCPICGSRSTFLLNGLLTDWSVEKKENESNDSAEFPF